jgi:hypothetical protein
MMIITVMKRATGKIDSFLFVFVSAILNFQSKRFNRYPCKINCIISVELTQSHCLHLDMYAAELQSAGGPQRIPKAASGKP